MAIAAAASGRGCEWDESDCGLFISVTLAFRTTHTHTFWQREKINQKRKWRHCVCVSVCRSRERDEDVSSRKSLKTTHNHCSLF
jgi:hypothetical protein